MTFSRLFVGAVTALVATLSLGTGAEAQTPGAIQQQADHRAIMESDRMERELTPGSFQARDRRGRQLTPPQVAEAAGAAVTAAGLTCEVTESALLGTTHDNNDLFEVACERGTGYILTSATPPQTFECVVLAAQADEIRAQGGELAPNSVCRLPGNQGAAGAIATFAAEAGLSCRVDAGKALGFTPEGNAVYEVGCAGEDGYHIERTAEGWRTMDCLQAMAINLTCEYTTVAEQAAAFKPLLAGTALDICDPAQLHLLGQNASGRFIEVKCTSGEGFVARVKDRVIGQVYTCGQAVRIGGGCTLTPVTPAETPASSEQ